MTDILFSIITVTYNAASVIDKTLISLMNQHFKNYELIIVDGKSKDDTIEKIKDYAKQFPQIKIISEPDKGIYDAMNKGMKNAIGRFIFFLNAGDVFFDNDALLKVSKKINNYDCVYYGDALTLDEKGEISYYRKGKFSKYKLAHSNICHQTIFYPRIIYTSKEYNLKYPLLADWMYNMSIFRKIPFIAVDVPICIYDLYGASATLRDENFLRDYKKSVLKYLGLDVILFLVIRKIYFIIKRVVAKNKT